MKYLMFAAALTLVDCVYTDALLCDQAYLSKRIGRVNPL